MDTHGTLVTADVRTERKACTPEYVVWHATVQRNRMTANDTNAFEQFTFCGTSSLLLFAMRANRLMFGEALPLCDEAKDLRVLVAYIARKHCGDMIRLQPDIPMVQLRTFALTTCASYFSDLMNNACFDTELAQADWCTALSHKIRNNPLWCFQRSEALRKIACVHYLCVLLQQFPARAELNVVRRAWQHFKESNPLSSAVGWTEECDPLVAKMINIASTTTIVIEKTNAASVS